MSLLSLVFEMIAPNSTSKCLQLQFLSNIKHSFVTLIRTHIIPIG